MLVLDGYLCDLLRFQVGSDRLEFSADCVYGATHQFSPPEAGVPARFISASAGNMPRWRFSDYGWLRPCWHVF